MDLYDVGTHLQKMGITLYLTMLCSALMGKEEAIELFDIVLSDAQKLISGEKNAFQIDRDHFHIIELLAEKHKDEIKAIDINDKPECYRQLKTILKQEE
jgi:hypothetical protein